MHVASPRDLPQPLDLDHGLDARQCRVPREGATHVCPFATASRTFGAFGSDQLVGRSIRYNQHGLRERWAPMQLQTPDSAEGVAGDGRPCRGGFGRRSTSGTALYQYLSRWILPSGFLRRCHSEKPRPVRNSAAASTMPGLPQRNTCWLPGSSSSPQAFSNVPSARKTFTLPTSPLQGSRKLGRVMLAR